MKRHRSAEQTCRDRGKTLPEPAASSTERRSNASNHVGPAGSRCSMSRLHGFRAAAQNSPGPEPKSVVLLFREDFKSGVPNLLLLKPEHLTNPHLELKLYGPGAKETDNPQSGLLLENEEDAANPGQITSYVGRESRPAAGPFC